MYQNRYSDTSSGISALFTIIFIGCLVMVLGIIATRIVKGVQFDRDCSGYLTRASNSGTVPNAVSQLKVALDYIEKEKLTEGFTSVIFNTPDEDIGFWYKNIKDTYQSLVSLPENASELEKSNALMKLREVVTSHGSEGATKLTVPDGISVYPNNRMYTVLFWMSFLGGILSLLIITQTE